MVDKTALGGKTKWIKKNIGTGASLRKARYWGESPSQSAHDALKLFLANNVKSVLVPGSGYGRNTKLFSASGLDVVGIEISETAYKMARQFDPPVEILQRNGPGYVIR